MGRAVHPHIITPDRALAGKHITRSLRFNPSDSTHLEKTFSSAGNRRTFTFSFWIKRTTTGRNSFIFSPQAGGDGSNESRLYITSNDQFRIYDSGGSSGYIVARAAAKLRDVSSWYHCIVAIDTTQSTDSNRGKFYINGVQQEIDTSGFHQWGNQNQQLGWGNNIRHRIGSDGYQNSFSDGMIIADYLAEVHYINGLQLDASYFGFTEPQTGIWTPKKYTGNYGTNGFYLNFSDNSATTAATLGRDRSGNANNFTPNNFSVAAGEGNDSSLDTPTNNLCTLNPLERFTHNCTLSNGNLKATGPNESYPGAAADVALSSGKWYYEFVINTKTSNPMCGVCKNDYVSGGAGRILYRSTGHYVMHDGSEPSDPDSFAVGDIIGVAIDLDDAAGKIRFYKNGTLQTVNSNLNSLKSQLSISTLGGLHPYIQMYHNDVCTVNFGHRPFSYTPPSGHKKLTPNTNNNSLDYSTPSILDPKEHFKTLVWTGNRTNNRSITGLEFQPDLVWIKKRDTTIMSHFFISSAQTYTSSGSGNGNVGAFVSGTNSTDAEGTTTDGGFVSFNKDGFTLGKGSDDSNDDSAYQRMNANSAGYVAWCWKAGNTYASNSDGTITSSVSANTEAGFSIVSYTGNETNDATVGHGLSKSPDMVIIKDRDSNSAGNNWYIFNSGLASGHYLKLNQNSATAALSGTSNGGVGSVTSTTFNFIQGTAGNNKNTNENGDRFIAYCWHSVLGYSKIGSFKGNANANGPFVYTGFRPAFILFKNSSTTTNWEIYDTTRPYATDNPASRNLYANTSGQEETNTTLPLLDILSNGFKPRSTWDEFNKSNDTILYMAFAEQPGGITPFQTSANAR